MRALIIRELIVGARTPALTLAAVGYVGLQVAFVVAWPAGVPVSPGPSLYGQLGVLQWCLLAVIAPWASTRADALERGNAIAVLSVETARPPSAHLTAKIIATVITMAALEFSGLPVAVLAQQMAATPLAQVPRDLLAQLGLALLVSAVTACWVAAVGRPLGAWIGATGSVAALLGLAVLWSPGLKDLGMICAAFGTLAAAGLAIWADRSLVFLTETTR